MVSLLEEEENNREGDADIKRHKDEVILPGQLLKAYWRSLRKNSCDQPVSNASGKSITTSTDLHGHDFRHVNPGDWTKGEREDDGDAENEEDTGNGHATIEAILVLRVDGPFADQGDGNSNGPNEEGLATSDFVEEKDDENQIWKVA